MHSGQGTNGMDKDKGAFQFFEGGPPSWLSRRQARRHRPWPIFVLAFITFCVLGTHIHLTNLSPNRGIRIPAQAATIQKHCQSLKLHPSSPPLFYNRSVSDRFVPGTKPTLIRNATIWTGLLDGVETVQGDIFLENGLIKAVGHIGPDALNNAVGELVVIDAHGSWATPGIVDLHAHIGDSPSPELSGAVDDNSLKGIVQPWLRALDALNTHDDSYLLSISGGVTTSLVLPGSANGIGGQGFVIKLRSTTERTPTSMLLEPPFTLDASDSIDWSLPPKWRQMKHACGENPSGVYGNTRMDNIWAFREIYDNARQIMTKQDEYCAKALNDDWEHIGAFPEDLQYEALVDVLRGRVKVHVHCYEAVDLDDIIRLTNEFAFPIAAFHHAHEAYLVPDLLKRAYGQTPGAALFATQARYKREAFRGSEFAPRILAANNISVVMKSDHPILNSRYLLYEAQQAHYYGLPENLALASVTTTPAKIMGMNHRIGLIKKGYDADVVLWDSHPLVLGATPTQVFIDGIAELDHPYVVKKPESLQSAPITPNFDKEVADTVKYEGLPPLEPRKSISGTVVLKNVRSMTVRANDVKDGVIRIFEAQDNKLGVLVVRNGRTTCAGLYNECSAFLSSSDAKVVDLKGGTIAPGLVSFGAPIGLEEIEGESSTSDGYVYEPLSKHVPSIVGGAEALIHAADGLRFATRDAYSAYHAGVTTGITAPKSRDFLSGLSTAFSLGAAHKLQPGALMQETAALHVNVGHLGDMPSISTQIATLRRLLLDGAEGELGLTFKDIVNGRRVLVVHTHNADTISTLLNLKREVEQKTSAPLKLTIAGGTEAHLLAKELGEASVGVILIQSRPFPYTWDHRRILPGPPLTRNSSISSLLAHNVTVGIGIEESWSARNARFDAAWAALESGGFISATQALALASTSLETLLGVERSDPDLADLIALEGADMFSFESKVIGVIAPGRGVVDLFG